MGPTFTHVLPVLADTGGLLGRAEDRKHVEHLAGVADGHADHPDRPVRSRHGQLVEAAAGLTLRPDRAADGLAVAQHVAPVAGDEGVVAGEQVGGEVLDVGDLVAVAGQRRRVGLVQASALELLGEDELAQGEVGGGVVVVGESVGPFRPE